MNHIREIFDTTPPTVKVRYIEPNKKGFTMVLNEYEFNNLRIFCLENKTTDYVEVLGLNGDWIKMNDKADLDWENLSFNIIQKQLSAIFKLRKSITLHP